MTVSFRSSEHKHWLVDVAYHAGVHDLKLQSGAPFTQIRAAWAEIARASNVPEEVLADRVAQHFRLKVANLDEAEHQTAKLLPERTAKKHGVLPIRASDQMLIVATSDPVNLEAEQEIQFLAGRQPVFQVAAPGPLLEAIERAYSREKIVDFVLQTLAAEASMDDLRIVRSGSASVESTQAPQPSHSIANLVNRVLRQAIRSGTSSIVIGPTGESGEVQFRIDGLIEHFMHLPMPALVRMVKRVKELARIDLDRRVQRQDGRFRVTVEGTTYRLRVTTEPARSVDRVTIRVTQPDAHPGIEDLLLTESEKKTLSAITESDGGLVLVAVPEGTSRSRVLTALTRTLGASGKRAVSLETSVDYDMVGVETIRADPEHGFGFSEALARALQDGPEVVSLGELSDPHTASLALDAAERGTLVLALCRGEDAIAGVARLTALGVDRQRIADNLKAVIAERLIRRICRDCGRPVRAADDIPVAERLLAEAYGVTPVQVPSGCEACRGTGFRGRIPILEIIPFEGRFPDMMRAGALLSDLKNEARSFGVPDLRDAGISRVTSGDSTVREVERVLGPTLTRHDDSEAATVLIVDDTAADRMLMRTLLEQRGFTVLEAGNGLDALEVLQESSGVSLVLLDLLMPGMDGRETLGGIRSSMRTAGIPVIILTAADDPTLELQLLEAGADDYLGKPFEPARLMARVGAVMRRAHSWSEQA